MFFGTRRGADRAARSSIGIATGLFLAVLLTLPVAADDSRLSSPDVTPRSGTTATTFALGVTYRAPSGRVPEAVVAIVGGATIALQSESTTWTSGVRFTWAGTLPVGDHAVTFRATTSDKRPDELSGGSVTVVMPATPPPTPAPTPAPTPPPTAAPLPTAAPTPTPTAAPTPRSSVPPPAPTQTPPATATPVPTPAGPDPDPSAPPLATPDAGAGIPPSPSPSDGARTAPAGAGGPDGSSAPSGGGFLPTGPGRPDPFGSGGGEPVDPDWRGATAAVLPSEAGAGDGHGGTSDVTADAWGPPVSTGGWGDLTGALELLGIDTGQGPEMRLMQALVGSAGAVTVLMAFGFFGKRRRDGESPEPDEVLEGRAARGMSERASAALVSGNGEVAVLPFVLDAEVGMPRWRRPSLIEARRADPSRQEVQVASMTFTHGLVQAVEGLERRLIRYTVVELLEQPDELRSAKIGALTKGDEVQLLERSGSHWHVLCPDGRRGWLHRMTLGDVVGQPASPNARQTWATDSFEEEVDGDVLAAFMTARGRA